MKNHLFETETCSRCGGTGNYSYNQIDGTVCFGCHGNKVRLTKRGAAAQAWYTAQQTVPVSALSIGDLVWEENYYGGYRAWFRVDAINGDKVDLSYLRKGRDKRDELGVHGRQSFRVRSPDKATRLWQQMVGLAYQASLTKAGKPRKG